jgi:hypothetical protein
MNDSSTEREPGEDTVKDLAELDPTKLRDFDKWRTDWGKPDFTLWNYVNYRSDPELAVAFATLFWPKVVDVDGCILLAEHYNPHNFAHWKVQLAGNCQEIERVINHVHVYDLFTHSGTSGTALEALEYLAQVLMRCWECNLRETFPNRRFVLAYATEPEEYGPTITFFQAPAETPS